MLSVQLYDIWFITNGIVQIIVETRVYGRAVANGDKGGGRAPAKSTVPPANFDRVISTTAYKRVWSLS